MDAARNPFTPGAGTQPPALTGRDGIIEGATVALNRIKLGRVPQSQMLLGLRGVGKTVLLNKIEEIATGLAFLTITLEAPEERPLAEMLVPPLRTLLYRLSKVEKARIVAQRALGVLRAFASAFSVKAGEAEFGVTPETGTADSGILESDLPELIATVSQAARQAEGAVALFIDEVQYLSEKDLSALIVSAHKASQKSLPFILFGAGLPQLAGLAGEAKSYAERLFTYPEVGPLSELAARKAISDPLQDENVEIDEDALTEIVQKTKGYPYFLQEWGAHAWMAASCSPIKTEDVAKATVNATATLDKGFFRVRLDRLNPSEKNYVRAMAELGPGPHRSGDIARKRGILVTSAAPVRSGLIRKGMIYSPAHGDTAFTVPMFDEFMRRAMPMPK